MTIPASVTGVSNLAFYRVYVDATNSHFWTSDRNEFLTLINIQYAYVGEGVATFIMPYIDAQGNVSPQVTNSIPFYRAAFQGANLHYWTSDADEYFGRNGKHLPTGYLGEGIASYIFPASGAQLSDAPFTPAMETAPEQAVDDGTPALVSVANGASRARSGVVSPGQVLTVYGRHLGGKVLLNGAPAQVLESQAGKLQILVPTNLAGASEVTVEVSGTDNRRSSSVESARRTNPIKLTVVPADPAIFGSNAFGRGNAQARNADGTINGADHAAERGSVVTLFTTGFATANQPIEVHIAGRPAEVLSAHLSGTRAGTIEVQVRVPQEVEPAAYQPVVLHVGELFSQPGVTLAIR